MADKANPVVAINLDKERHLKLTLNAFIDFKQATGKDLRQPDVWAQLQSSLEFADLRALLWACLRWEDKTLGLEDVGFLLNPLDIEIIAGKLVETLNAALAAVKRDAAPLA